MRSKVVLEPNHPRFTKGYWVSIDRMENIAGIPLAKRARIEVEADRKQNRITVKSTGVEAFTLLLNDDMVDLDDPKGVTVIVNDKAVTKKRGRDFQRVFETGVRRRSTTPAGCSRRPSTAGCQSRAEGLASGRRQVADACAPSALRPPPGCAVSPACAWS